MAAVDYFLKLEGIEGESKDSKHANEIDVLSFSWGVTNSGTAALGGGMGAGKAVPQDFHVVCATQKSSPKFLLACANGEHIKKATLVCRKAGKEQQEYLKIEFKDVMLSSYQIGGSNSGDILPSDQVSMNFAEIKMEYKAQKPDGTLDGPTTGGYNFSRNEEAK